MIVTDSNSNTCLKNLDSCLIMSLKKRTVPADILIMTNTITMKFVRLFLWQLNGKAKSTAMLAVCLVSFWNTSASAQLKKSDLGNQPVSEMAESPIQNSRTQQEAQISPEEYKRLMKELEEAKKLMEERNLALDKLMKE
ncbi:MAG: hypothetical protein IPK68_17130 [Bdellovibrionales bacterium]|nr:hypothetical protein [Bdellovibrionales bacterium]